ncbi:SDR family oxidoreductase [Prochlorococcus sp. MIT 1300]|uniref:SDR family NAD(P)-dependent oxidoreductase n=1 Tax=Prochlorococcus sp. MIT 1300 TaxID=3096218 RepID=UPI002A7663A2|nr:SDR family oxidoreductase [Prochlorococcus sp. MIT 1300]
MDLGIKEKSCLVTGGCNGIGAEITRSLLKEGCRVTATSRSAPEEFISTLNQDDQSRFNYLLAELSSTGGLQNFLNQNNFDFDILINNAGHTLDVKDPFCSLEQWGKVMHLNFYACVELVNQVVPHMRRSEWGRIVNITSCAGLENSGPVTFTTAKAALTAYTRSMGRVLAIESPGIVMTAVYPGVIVTPGGHWDSILKENPDHAKKYIEERCPLGRFGKISEFVPAVMFFASSHASFAHGSIVGIDGGQSKHFMQYNYEP